MKTNSSALPAFPFRRRVTSAAIAVLAMTAAFVGPLGASPALAAGRVNGVDVSHWNGAPNWRRAQASGVRFVIAKASEGRNFVDPAYARNKAQAEALGLAFTAYHYASPDRTWHDAQAEARLFVRTARLSGNNLIPALDLEQSGGLSSVALTRWVKAFVVQVDALLGVKVMIYTSPSFWATHMANSTWFADHGYRLWVAHWGVDQPRVPAQRWQGQGWTLWQRTSSARISGFSGRVDRDAFSATSLRTLTIRNNLE